MLHIISNTPIASAILERTSTGDSIILIENAVIEAVLTAAEDQVWKTVLQSQKVFVLADDLAVRGLATDRIVSGIEMVDYQGFVQLTCDNEVVYSWH